MTRPTPPVNRHGARRIGTGSAHAKAILLGEHAVLYGAPALALPVPQLTVTASASWSPAANGPHDVLLTMAGSPELPAAEAAGSLGRLAAETRRFLGVPHSPPLDVIVDCAIPPGRGLGSSAACARATVLALADLFGRDLPHSAVFDLVQSAEHAAHGRASGVDAAAVGAGAPLLFQQGRAQDLPVGCDGLFLLADSGGTGRTKDAVQRLRTHFTQHAGAQETFVRRAGELAQEARRALARGRARQFGACLTENHQLLRAAGLSTARIDALVQAALAAGSLGAKITGGGLGGCMIALARTEQAREVTRSLHRAGAAQVWSVPLKGPSWHAR